MHYSRGDWRAAAGSFVGEVNGGPSTVRLHEVESDALDQFIMAISLKFQNPRQHIPIGRQEQIAGYTS